MRTSLNNKEFLSKLIKTALPITLQNLMLALVAVSDSLMLGNLEQNFMAAVTLATQIQFVQNMFMSSTVEASAILGAQYWGKGDRNSLNSIFCTTFKICGAIGLIAFAGCFFLPRQLMLIFTNEEVLIQIGIDYLRIAGWSYLLTGFSQCYLAIMKVTGHPDSTAKISSFAVVLNILLNAVFIFGLCGVPAMGVKGAAIATLIARIVEIIMAVGMSYKKDYVHIHFRDIFKPHKELFHDFMKCWLPLLGAFLLWGVGFTSYTAFMGHLGTDAAAANSICAIVRDVICCLCNGLASGGGIIVGHELGAGKLEKGKEYGIKVTILAFICGFLSALLMFILTPIALRFIKLSDGATALLYQMMLVMTVYMIGRAVNTIIINGIFAAGGDTLFDLYSLAVVMWGFAVPLAALGTFVFHWPVVIVYACTCLDEVGKIPWVVVHFRKYKWVKDLTR
ncbi:MAG: MATE family efflux transporter [Treponema sp.]|nr:MATE family efflux transporter [Treponema sp.]